MSDPMIDEFLIEAEEMFEEAELSLLNLDKGEDFNENYNNIFRAFHSIKGAAGMFYLDALKEHMHYLETTFDKFKEIGELTKPQIDYFLSGVDAARSILAGNEVDFGPLEAQTGDAAAAKSTPEEQTVAQEHIQKKVEEKKDALELKNKVGLVYIVDDEELICDALKDILEDADLQCKTFLNAADALAAIKEGEPDLLMTDIKMPGMSGVEMIRELDSKGIELPTILVSSYITKQVCIEVLSYGAYGIVEKPFDEDLVKDMAIKAVKKSKAFKLINKSINLLLYQFSDLAEFLDSSGKENIKLSIESDLQHILEQKQILSKLGEK